MDKKCTWVKWFRALIRKLKHAMLLKETDGNRMWAAFPWTCLHTTTFNMKKLLILLVLMNASESVNKFCSNAALNFAPALGTLNGNCFEHWSVWITSYYPSFKCILIHLLSPFTLLVNLSCLSLQQQILRTEWNTFISLADANGLRL